MYEESLKILEAVRDAKVVEGVKLTGHHVTFFLTVCLPIVTSGFTYFRHLFGKDVICTEMCHSECTEWTALTLNNTSTDWSEAIFRSYEASLLLQGIICCLPFLVWHRRTCLHLTEAVTSSQTFLNNIIRIFIQYIEQYHQLQEQQIKLAKKRQQLKKRRRKSTLAKVRKIQRQELQNSVQNKVKRHFEDILQFAEKSNLSWQNTFFCTLGILTSAASFALHCLTQNDDVHFCPYTAEIDGNDCELLVLNISFYHKATAAAGFILAAVYFFIQIFKSCREIQSQEHAIFCKEIPFAYNLKIVTNSDISNSFYILQQYLYSKTEISHKLEALNSIKQDFPQDIESANRKKDKSDTTSAEGLTPEAGEEINYDNLSEESENEENDTDHESIDDDRETNDENMSKDDVSVLTNETTETTETMDSDTKAILYIHGHNSNMDEVDFCESNEMISETNAMESILEDQDDDDTELDEIVDVTVYKIQVTRRLSEANASGQDESVILENTQDLEVTEIKVMRNGEVIDVSTEYRAPGEGGQLVDIDKYTVLDKENMVFETIQEETSDVNDSGEEINDDGSVTEHIDLTEENMPESNEMDTNEVENQTESLEGIMVDGRTSIQSEYGELCEEYAESYTISESEHEMLDDIHETSIGDGSTEYITVDEDERLLDIDKYTIVDNESETIGFETIEEENSTADDSEGDRSFDENGPMTTNEEDHDVKVEGDEADPLECSSIGNIEVQTHPESEEQLHDNEGIHSEELTNAANTIEHMPESIPEETINIKADMAPSEAAEMENSTPIPETEEKSHTEDEMSPSTHSDSDIETAEISTTQPDEESSLTGYVSETSHNQENEMADKDILSKEQECEEQNNIDDLSSDNVQNPEFDLRQSVITRDTDMLINDKDMVEDKAKISGQECGDYQVNLPLTASDKPHSVDGTDSVMNNNNEDPTKSELQEYQDTFIDEYDSTSLETSTKNVGIPDEIAIDTQEDFNDQIKIPTDSHSYEDGNGEVIADPNTEYLEIPEVKETENIQELADSGNDEGVNDETSEYDPGYDTMRSESTKGADECGKDRRVSDSSGDTITLEDTNKHIMEVETIHCSEIQSDADLMNENQSVQDKNGTFDNSEDNESDETRYEQEIKEEYEKLLLKYSAPGKNVVESEGESDDKIPELKQSASFELYEETDEEPTTEKHTVDEVSLSELRDIKNDEEIELDNTRQGEEENVDNNKMQRKEKTKFDRKYSDEQMYLSEEVMIGNEMLAFSGNDDKIRGSFLLEQEEPIEQPTKESDSHCYDNQNINSTFSTKSNNLVYKVGGKDNPDPLSSLTAENSVLFERHSIEKKESLSVPMSLNSENLKPTQKSYSKENECPSDSNIDTFANGKIEQSLPTVTDFEKVKTNTESSINLTCQPLDQESNCLTQNLSATDQVVMNLQIDTCDETRQPSTSSYHSQGDTDRKDAYYPKTTFSSNTEGMSSSITSVNTSNDNDKHMDLKMDKASEEKLKGVYTEVTLDDMREKQVSLDNENTLKGNSNLSKYESANSDIGRTTDNTAIKTTLSLDQVTDPRKLIRDFGQNIKAHLDDVKKLDPSDMDMGRKDANGKPKTVTWSDTVTTRTISEVTSTLEKHKSKLDAGKESKPHISSSSISSSNWSADLEKKVKEEMNKIQVESPAPVNIKSENKENKITKDGKDEVRLLEDLFAQMNKLAFRDTNTILKTFGGETKENTACDICESVQNIEAEVQSMNEITSTENTSIRVGGKYEPDKENTSKTYGSRNKNIITNAKNDDLERAGNENLNDQSISKATSKDFLSDSHDRSDHFLTLKYLHRNKADQQTVLTEKPKLGLKNILQSQQVPDSNDQKQQITVHEKQETCYSQPPTTSDNQVQESDKNMPVKPGYRFHGMSIQSGVPCQQYVDDIIKTYTQSDSSVGSSSLQSCFCDICTNKYLEVQPDGRAVKKSCTMDVIARSRELLRRTEEEVEQSMALQSYARQSSPRQATYATNNYLPYQSFIHPGSEDDELSGKSRSSSVNEDIQNLANKMNELEKQQEEIKYLQHSIEEKQNMKASSRSRNTGLINTPLNEIELPPPRKFSKFSKSLEPTAAYYSPRATSPSSKVLANQVYEAPTESIIRRPTSPVNNKRPKSPTWQTRTRVRSPVRDRSKSPVLPEYKPRLPPSKNTGLTITNVVEDKKEALPKPQTLYNAPIKTTSVALPGRKEGVLLPRSDKIAIVLDEEKSRIQRLADLELRIRAMEEDMKYK